MSYLKEYNFDLLNEALLTPESFNPVEWQTRFQNNNPIIVEIGCGNGHYLIKLAQEEKEKNFIGIDIKNKRIIRCREKELKYNLKNITWICGEALKSLNLLFNDNSIDEMLMPFPDPWPKKRHHKKRLFKKNFIDIFYSKLKKNGIFTFITDYKEYFDVSLELINNDKRFQLFKNSDQNKDKFTTSLFGEKWKKENREFYLFSIKKL
jgi:tRNA (guanine-N7-)-methyltransferase